MDRALPPPSGHPPPETADLAGERVQLRPLAEAVAERHLLAHPEELERYGENVRAWCVHDNQHVIGWAIHDAEGWLDLDEHVAWLARVLSARGYPLASLADSLESAADVVAERLGPGGQPVADRLRSAAGNVRPQRSPEAGGN